MSLNFASLIFAALFCRDFFKSRKLSLAKISDNKVKEKI